MNELIDCLRAVFADLQHAELSEQTRLGEIPGFDSLNRFNLLLELESRFAVDVENTVLSEEARVADLFAHLREKGARIQ